MSQVLYKAGNVLEGAEAASVWLSAGGAVPVESPLDLRPLVNRMGDWMLTYSGRKYWPVDPWAADVSIVDIAHALSMQCRYGGHAGAFYSVAEHSVLVSQWVPQEHALVALMHDATEAYVSDVPRPLKPHLASYEEIERRNWRVIATAFDLPREIPACVHDVDLRLCKAEMTDLFGYAKAKEAVDSIPGDRLDAIVRKLPPMDAKKLFLDRFNKLWQEKLDALFPAARMGRTA